ncbi:hypothetical protein ACOSQ3_030956 [Xanthoceras sorbifolium]
MNFDVTISLSNTSFWFCLAVSGKGNHTRSFEKGNRILKMNQDDLGNNHDALQNIPVKRRRGRPRKHPRPNVNRGENAVLRGQNLNRQENAPIPPGFGGINGNQPQQVNPNNNANTIGVGQVVQGVIEASFDAGYLLTVRVGNSENTLRGVVFKPGHYVPVAAHNDVAPNVPMIRRNEVPLPAANLNQVHGHNRSWERNEQRVNSHRNGTAKLGVSRAKRVSPMPIQIAHPVPRNKVVPVVLQPVNLPNGGTVANQPPPLLTLPSPLEATKGKQVQEDAYPSNGSEPTNQVQTVGNQVLPSPRTSKPGMPDQVPVEKLCDAEVTSMRLPCAPFENLLSEVINRIQPPSQSDETQMKNNDDMYQPLSIEPLQAVQPDQNIQSASLPKPFGNFRTGKMTELLRAVQENIMENQSPQTEEPARSSRPSAEAKQEEKENGHPRAPSV